MLKGETGCMHQDYDPTRRIKYYRENIDKNTDKKNIM